MIVRRGSERVLLFATVSRSGAGSVGNLLNEESSLLLVKEGNTSVDPISGYRIRLSILRRDEIRDQSGEKERRKTRGETIPFYQPPHRGSGAERGPGLRTNEWQMEDEGNHGNDDTRCFILSTLAALQWSRVSCVLCRSPMLVFDRYPLVDGTFFLSPRQHSPACAEVKVEGRTQFLSAVCMGCLEGSGGQPVRCRCCTQPWDGSSLVLGTMYSYDIFAAMPCCTERLKCNSCQKPLIYPHQRLNFYSDYSRVFACPHCRAVDAHFVKPLSICFTREQFQLYSQWP
ncbi:headcase protein isoform X2 [Osmia lignaria lignaria]|uniref:headcase protein isoform X2 n=1 Tax=Osmia lignaria lignaria TaxID=1437193 RepID=UPI00402B1D65